MEGTITGRFTSKEPNFSQEPKQNTKQFPTYRSDYSPWISSLEGVEVGDVFLVPVPSWDDGPAVEKATCTKVTATQAVIGTRRFRIKDAKEVGGHKPLLNYTTEAWCEEESRQQRKRKLAALKNFNWRTLSDSELLAVSVIIKPYLEKEKT